MLSQVPAFLWTTDLDLRVTELVCDDAHGRGLTPVGETLPEFWGTSDPVGAVDAHARAAEGESVEYEATIFDRTLATHVEPLRNARGEIVGVVGVAIDVTADRRLQQELARAQQLEALGRFAGGVAHDINNMLFGINGFIDLALAQEIDAEAERHLRSASATLEHSAEMTRQLLAFSRGQAVELQPLSLNGAVHEASPLLEQLAGDSCLIELALADELPPIMADPTQLEQVLTNLVVNARDAGGNTIVVGTRLRVLDQPLAVDGFDLARARGSSSRSPTTVSAWTPRRGASLRAVLHDEGRGHRPRARDCLRARAPGGRRDRRRVEPRRGHDDAPVLPRRLRRLASALRARTACRARRARRADGERRRSRRAPARRSSSRRAAPGRARAGCR